jgi:hypothetical protein
MTSNPFRTFVLVFAFAAGLAVCAAGAHRAAAAAAVVIASGSNATRTTIPVTIDGLRATCVLDTGTSAMIVSPSLAQAAGLASRAGTFELAPDGRTYVDRQTNIARFAVSSYVLRDVAALISPNLQGDNALCGYDFFSHFPTLIERDRRQVTLFPASARLAHMRCTPIDLSPRVPLATIEINDTWLSRVVLDSGMAGGGAIWDGVRPQLKQPLVANAEYDTEPSAVREGFACGATAAVRYAGGTPASAMPICTEPQRPDGYNGIIETNLASVRAMDVDYPHRRICFDVLGQSGGAWARFDALRAPNR